MFHRLYGHVCVLCGVVSICTERRKCTDHLSDVTFAVQKKEFVQVEHDKITHITVQYMCRTRVGNMLCLFAQCFPQYPFHVNDDQETHTKQSFVPHMTGRCRAIRQNTRPFEGPCQLSIGSPQNKTLPVVNACHILC